jgi:hypothetical protein
LSWMMSTPVLGLSQCLSTTEWPVPSNANTILLTPGWCSVRSHSNQVGSLGTTSKLEQDDEGMHSGCPQQVSERSRVE